MKKVTKKNDHPDDDFDDLASLIEPFFINITLSDEEMQMGIDYGKQMWKVNCKAGRSGRVCDVTTEEDEIAWIHSEIAVAQWEGLPYENPINKFTSVPDVHYADVKWTLVIDYGVPVRRNHPNHRPIVSVAGRAPNLVLRGWEYSHHMKLWAWDRAKLKSNLLRETVESPYDKDDKIIFPWRYLKPMYLLTRERNAYRICFGCDGQGISEELVPCTHCELGKMLGKNPEAFKQLLRVRGFQSAA